MRCPNCGVPNEFRADNCMSCGLRLGTHRARILLAVAMGLVLGLALLVILT